FKDKELVDNIVEFREAFAIHYPNINIGYSVKTNYIPYACKIAYQQGAYIEVVSEMELQLALNARVPPDRIIYNGTTKDNASLEYCLLNDVKINIDNYEELKEVLNIGKMYKNSIFKIGIRINLPMNDHFESRFGFDSESKDFLNTLQLIESS